MSIYQEQEIQNQQENQFSNELGSESGRSSSSLVTTKQQQAAANVQANVVEYDRQPRRSVTPSPVLTTHELYELNQQQQAQNQSLDQQTVASSATAIPTTSALSLMRPVNPINRQISPPNTFRNSSIHGQHRALERQESIIVGTPGFREKYGKLFSIYFSLSKNLLCVSPSDFF